jgi:hypothetical protein
MFSDDLTVQVIFFGQGSKGEGIIENTEASTPIKARL